MKKILFLDMDGVLNDDAFYSYSREKIKEFISANRVNFTLRRHINPVTVYNLRYILEQDKAIRIVISSTWRKHFTLKEMQYMLGKHGVPKNKIIGMTDNPKDKHEGKGDSPDIIQRGDLCVKWAKENEVDIFVCVDDNSDFDICKDQLVQTDGRDGLTRSKAIEILKLFGNELKDYNDQSRE